MQWFHSRLCNNRPDARSSGPRHANGVAHCDTPSIMGVAKGVVMGVLRVTSSTIDFPKVTIVEASNQFNVLTSLVVGLTIGAS